MSLNLSKEERNYLQERLGVSRVAIENWNKGIRPVPLDRAIQIEIATCGRYKAENLCPKRSKEILFLKNQRNYNPL